MYFERLIQLYDMSGIGKGKNQILQRVDLVPYALIYELADRMPAPKEVSLR